MLHSVITALNTAEPEMLHRRAARVVIDTWRLLYKENLNIELERIPVDTVFSPLLLLALSYIFIYLPNAATELSLLSDLNAINLLNSAHVSVDSCAALVYTTCNQWERGIKSFMVKFCYTAK